MAVGKFSARNRINQSKQDGKGFNSSTLDTKGYELFKVESADPILVDIVAVNAGGNNMYTANGELALEATYWVHRGLGPEGKDSVVCNRRTGRSRNCPICAQASQAWDDGDKETYGLLKARQRQLWWIKPIDETDWKVWDVSSYLFGKQLETEFDNLDEDEAHYEYFADPGAGGASLKISFNEKEFGSNKFYEAASIRFRDRNHELDVSVVESLPALDSMIRFSTDDEVARLAAGESASPAVSAPVPEVPVSEPTPEPEVPAVSSSDDDDDWDWN